MNASYTNSDANAAYLMASLDPPAVHVQQMNQELSLSQQQQTLHSNENVPPRLDSNSSNQVNNNTSSASTHTVNTMNNFNFNSISASNSNASQQQQQQQLLNQLMAAINANGGNNVNSSLFQQQQQPQQQSLVANNSASVNQNVQLSTLLQNQSTQQQQNDLRFSAASQQQRQHSLSLANLSDGLQQTQAFAPNPPQQQRHHSLSLAPFQNVTAAAPAPQQQQQQPQQMLPGALLGNIANGRAGSTAGALMALQQQQQRTMDPSAPAPAPSASKQHKQFLLFIKILLKCLDATQNTVLKQRTKAIVSECTRRNRQGVPGFTPLQDAVEKQLRGVVGEEYWTRAQKYVHTYNLKQPRLLARAQQRKQQQMLLRQQQQQQMLQRRLGAGLQPTQMTRL